MNTHNVFHDTEFLALLIIHYASNWVSIIIMSSIGLYLSFMGYPEIQEIDAYIHLLTTFIQAAVAIAGGILVHYKWKNRKSNK